MKHGLVFSWFLFCTIFYSTTTLAFPEIISWRNSPAVVFDNKTQAILVKKGLLKRPFAIVTASKDEFEFKVNHVDRIYIYEKTKAQVLDISREGSISDFYILDGKVRYSTEFRGAARPSTFDIALKTPFFDLKIANEADFFIELNMDRAWVEIKVVKGSLPLEFFAYEKKLTLKEGQSVKFQGVKADDKINIQYDYLLGGRKVPKGQLEEVKIFDSSAYLKAEAKLHEQENKKKKEAEFKRLEKIRKQKEYEDSFLCKKPFGHKDQCAWWLEDKKCYRKRCNAAGAWGDIIERPMNPKCKLQPVVAECDY